MPLPRESPKTLVVLLFRAAEQTLTRTLGMYHSQIDDYAATVAQFERFLQLAQQSGQPNHIALAQLNLRLDYCHLGLYAQAKAAYTTALQLAQAIDHQNFQANILVNWAFLAFCQGDAKTAVAPRLPLNNPRLVPDCYPLFPRSS